MCRIAPLFPMKCTSCTYFNNDKCEFFKLKNQEPKTIPKHIYYRGCKFYLEGEEHPLLKDTIKLFNGYLFGVIPPEH
mgnify:CR=1 FL=1